MRGRLGTSSSRVGYLSIYRFDDELLANAHVWGVNAYMAPVLHLRRLAEGSLFDTYAGSFEAVWATSRPVPRRGWIETMPRTDYFNDPHAPTPNSLVPAASAIVVSEPGELLLQRRFDNDQWALPGGTMDLGETLAQTVVREVREETGLDVEVTGLVGIYTDPGHVIEYDDGEVRQEFNICFTARVCGGRLATSTESKEVGWVPLDQLDALPMHESTRLRIRHHLDQRALPYIG